MPIPNLISFPPPRCVYQSCQHFQHFFLSLLNPVMRKNPGSGFPLTINSISITDEISVIKFSDVLKTPNGFHFPNDNSKEEKTIPGGRRGGGGGWGLICAPKSPIVGTGSMVLFNIFGLTFSQWSTLLRVQSNVESDDVLWGGGHPWIVFTITHRCFFWKLLIVFFCAFNFFSLEVYRFFYRGPCPTDASR